MLTMPPSPPVVVVDEDTTLSADTNLGNVLLRIGAVSCSQLQAAVLQQRAQGKGKRLGEVLIARGVLDADLLQHALDIQRHERSGDVLGLLGTLDRLVDAVAHSARSLSSTLDTSCEWSAP